MIYNFTNDYSEGCHPAILEALMQNNDDQEPGYGYDRFTREACDMLRDMTGDAKADVYMIAGGTLTNLVVLASMLKPYESVISASSGHINNKEAGAIEATGHKIESVYSSDGKLRPADIAPMLDKSPKYHTVKPRVVYISNSTEIGSIYTKAELTELSEFCKQNDLLLFIDGARLASALAARSNDLTLKDVAALVDVFYLGGTKCGALFGEAVVILNDDLKSDFLYYMKQHGALLAKARLMGTQFSVLLRNGLIFDLARHKNTMAERIGNAMRQLGYSFLIESDTNQIFPILPNWLIAKLSEDYGFYIWEKVDAKHSVIRLITSWHTPESAVDGFIEKLKSLH